MKTILITGGCGFVGRHLIGRLAPENDQEIWVIDDLSTGTHPACWSCPVLEISRTQPYRGATTFAFREHGGRLVFLNSDFLSVVLSELGRQPALGHPSLPRFDEVYHLASVVGGRALIENDPLAVGVDLAIDSCFFLWASRTNRPHRILYASSSAAYPISLQEECRAVMLREEMIDFRHGLLQPDYTYGWSKLTGEYLARLAASKYGLSVAVVRPFSGYGEDQDPTYPVPAIALRVAARRNPVVVWGSGRQGRDFVHIDDVVDACVRVCRTISDGTAVNIGSGILVSFRELAQVMIELEGYEAEVQGLEDRPVGVAQRFGDASRIRALVNWEPSISLREGLSRVLKAARRRIHDGFSPTA